MLSSIRSKLVATLSGMAIVVLLVAGVSYRDRRHVDQVLDNVAANQLPSGIALGRVSTALVTMQLWTRAGIIDLQAHDPEAIPVDRSKRDTALADLDRAWAAYEMLPMFDQEARLWHDFRIKYTAFKADNELIWAAITSGDATKTRERAAAGVRSAADALDSCAQSIALQGSLAGTQLREVDQGRTNSNTILIIVLIVSLGAVGLAGAQLVSSVMAPVSVVKSAADAIARGEFDVQFGDRPNNEFGLVHDALRSSLESLQSVALAAATIAKGDLDVHVTPKSQRDVLAESINGMARTLRNTARQANAVASGDFDTDIVPRGEKDELGLALKKMAASLKDVTHTAERISAGDVDVRAATKGDRDPLASAINTMAVSLKVAAAQANVIAAGNYDTDIAPRGDRDELGGALQKMTRSLRAAAQVVKETDWLKSGVATVNELVLGQADEQALAQSSLTSVANYLGAKVGALYILDQDSEGSLLRLIASYAYTQRKNLANRFRLGEGLVGQAALEKKQIVIENAPQDYVHVVSGLGEAVPRNICVVPLLFQGELRGVMELGTLTALSKTEQQYVDQVATIIATAFEIATKQNMVGRQQEELRASNDELQEQTRALATASQEMRAQQTELGQTNAELEAQMQRTMDSETRLKVQQRQLEVTNEELESRNRELERQKAEIEKARRELVIQAEELAIASKYKSEFLANMSHELRTPLNSLLLLARSLRDNPEGNLNDDQKESAGVIFASGNDLLNLINEILDLSKIEAGRMDLRVESVEVSDIGRAIVRQFEHMARNQGLTLSVNIAEQGPFTVVTDPARLGQVLKNLVGNALKFTEVGGVTVSFGVPSAGTNLAKSGLTVDRAIAIRVTDTGIGIPLDKQKIVFEAFQQADSGDKRRYGGTGLGLSISRELATLLGGEIQLESEPGVGSTFTVYLPISISRPQGESAASVASARAAASATSMAAAPLVASAPTMAAPTIPAAPSHFIPMGPTVERPVGSPGLRPVAQASINDDRDTIEDFDRTILIVEDDLRFAAVLVAEVRRRGFKCLATPRGMEGVELAKSYRPSGVILDINLPDTNGWAVLTALKQDVDTRHIPVHIVSAEEATMEGLRIGAIGHAHKPLRTEDIDSILATIEKSSASAEKLVLVVEDDPIMRRETVRIIGNGNVHVQEVGNGSDALVALRQRRFDLMVLDLGLPDMQGLELLKAANAEKAMLPPVIVYTVRELTSAEELSLRQYADSIIIKDVRSQERLIDEVALFLHRVVNDLPEEKRQTIRHLYESDEQLRGKKLLIVEDDMRTMFAMAKLLASHGINPLKAANGEQALAVMEEHPDVDLVLLDMMMPVMDGYETVRRLRRQPRFANLPVIALTAKAMKEDRQKCMEAGATDYLTKPVDQDRLLSLLRVWLCR